MNKINYPTGGHSEFDYVPDSFTNHYYPDIDKVNSTTKNIAVTDMNLSVDVTSGTFQLPATQTIKFVSTVYRGANTALTFESLLGAVRILSCFPINLSNTVASK
ncbi:MAG: hypothetical protein QM734_15390 [Cyclobacteriaceae bacterium]